MLHLEIALASEIDDLSKILTAKERELYKVTLFKKDRDLFLLGRLAAKRALQGFLGTRNLIDLSILPSENPKDQYKALSENSQKCLPIQLNMAHAAGIGIACVHPTFLIGIELERVKPITSNSSFNASDLQILQECTGEIHALAANVIQGAKKSAFVHLPQLSNLADLTSDLTNETIFNLLGGRQKQIELVLTHAKSGKRVVVISQFLHHKGEQFSLSFAVKQEEFLFFQKTDFSLLDLRALLSMVG